MAVSKLSQIAAAGGAPAVTDQAVFVTGGTTDNLVTVNQLGTALPLFTSTTRGQTPLSGGGTTNFLRADGTWQAPAGTPTAPGGANTQVQFNNAAAFGGITNLTTNGTNLVTARLASTSSLDWDSGAGAVDLSLFRDAANILAVRVGTTNTPMGLRVYNNATGGASEWATFDWITNANALTIATATSGGTQRAMTLNSGGAINFNTAAVSNWSGVALNMNSLPLLFDTNSGIGGSNIAKVTWFADAAGNRNRNGWYQWAGQARIDADFNTGNSTVLANITGSANNLSVTLQAGRTYSFRVELFTTSNVAAGVQFAIAGTCTATSIVYEALVYDAAAVKAQTKASALATSVGAVTAVTAAHCTITGTITVNLAGTLTVQAAQNVGNATGSVVQRGSHMVVQDSS